MENLLGLFVFLYSQTDDVIIDNDTFLLFFRDPYDCSSFYVCVVGKIGKKSTCDKGLVFDFKLKVCNWKSQVC